MGPNPNPNPRPRPRPSPSYDSAPPQPRWGDAQQIAELLTLRAARGFDTITASDVLYYPPATYRALAQTIRALSAADGAVVLSYRVRHGDEHGFIDLLTAADATDGTPPLFECVHRGAPRGSGRLGGGARGGREQRQVGHRASSRTVVKCVLAVALLKSTPRLSLRPSSPWV